MASSARRQASAMLSPIIARFSSRLTPSACSAWRARLADQRDHRRPGLPDRCQHRIVGRTAPRPPRHPEGAQLRMAQQRRLDEERIVGRIGPGPAALDVVDPEPVKLPGDPQLVGDGEVDALRLGAVAEGGVVEVQARHSSRHSVTCLPYLLAGTPCDKSDLRILSASAKSPFAQSSTPRLDLALYLFPRYLRVHRGRTAGAATPPKRQDLHPGLTNLHSAHI